MIQHVCLFMECEHAVGMYDNAVIHTHSLLYSCSADTCYASFYSLLQYLANTWMSSPQIKQSQDSGGSLQQKDCRGRTVERYLLKSLCIK